MALPVGSQTEPDSANNPNLPADWRHGDGHAHAASVIGPTAQNVNPSDFGAVIDALNSNTAYANIHTTNFPAGEIRGQVRRGERDDD